MKYLKIFSKENIIISTITFYIFFWDMFLTLGIKFDIRLVLIVISIYLIKEIINDLKKNNFNFVYLVIVIFSLLTIHGFFVGNILNIKFFLSICFLLYILGIVYYYGHTILNNKKKIIFLFVYLFLISILIHYIIGFSSNPEPFSCGGLKNFFGGKNTFDTPLFLIHFLSSYSLIFNENSHMAMSCVAVIIYSIYLFSERKENKFSISILTIFILITFLKSSASLLAGLCFSILCLLIFEYKRLNKFFIVFSLILLSSITFIFFQDKVCVNKLVYSTSNDPKLFENAYDSISNKSKMDENLSEIQKEFDNKDVFNKLLSSSKEEKDKILLSLSETEREELNNLLNKKRKIDQELEQYKSKKQSFRQEYRGSLSSDVFFHALNVTIHSIIAKPLGWGFQGYELAFNDYNKKNKIFRKPLEVYNNKDASNNTFKIITEFGIFSIILFLFLFYISISKKISLENKIFLFPFLITQGARGAGYFNGAFILILFLVIILQLKNSKTE